MNELNEKMTEFAGFTWYDEPCSSEGCSGHCGWRYPDGTTVYPLGMVGLPDFPNDLNACLEHLEPELFKRGFRYQLTRLQDGHKAEILEPGKGCADIVAYAFYKKPALAFCKAVEQLVDADKEKA